MERHHSSWYVDLLETVILGAKGHLAFINAFDLRQAGGGPTMVSLRLSLVSQLYAFFYVPNPPFPDSKGWSIYILSSRRVRPDGGWHPLQSMAVHGHKQRLLCASHPLQLALIAPCE